MIECLFTIDYEIYGDGEGSLKDLVFDPAERLTEIFEKWNVRYVNFVEVAEFEKIEERHSDPYIDRVRRQIRDLHRKDFEIALHLHPQWYNARFREGRWELDSSEYNLCTLDHARISEIVTRAVNYLRYAVDQPHFTPLSFRAGNWLFQPTKAAAAVLEEHGVKIDSSVFKGGLQHHYKLDYRGALKNGYYWPFSSDATVPDRDGRWMEVPIYSEMVPSWQMATSKRMSLGKNTGIKGQSSRRKFDRALDFLRFRYPRKFDFCRMTLEEMTSMVERVIGQDWKDPSIYRPLVAIGHTKDLFDFQAVDQFLAFLQSKNIAVRTFPEIYPKLMQRREDFGVPARNGAEMLDPNFVR